MVGGNAEGPGLLMPDEEVMVHTLPCPPKPAGKSIAMIGAGITVLFSLLGVAGVAYTDEDVKAWSQIATEAAPYVVTFVGGIVAWIGRRRANAPIKNGPADPKVIAQAKLDKARSEAVKKL